MSAYTEAVERNLKGLTFVSTGGCPGCEECGIPKQDGEDCPEDWEVEPSFSWSSCDACDSSLGGDRHVAHGWTKLDDDRDTLVHFEVCTDCLFYLNYGDEPEPEA